VCDQTLFICVCDYGRMTLDFKSRNASYRENISREVISSSCTSYCSGTSLFNPTIRFFHQW